MASCQLFRRLSPFLRNTSRLMWAVRPAVHMQRQTVLNQNLATHLTGFRCMSSGAQPEIVNIQDEKDFQERVIGAAKPVVVDFHAT